MSEPPANVEAETSVLGAVLVNAGALRAVISNGLKPEHFYLEKHRLIFRACSRLAALDSAVDPITVTEELKRAGALNEAGGDAYVAELPSRVGAPGNAPHHAGIVIEMAQLRSRQAGAFAILQGVEQRDGEAIAAGIQQVNADLEHGAEAVEPAELADEFAEFIFGDEPGVVWKSPFLKLNTLLAGGFYPGQVTALIGWASDGKTTVLDQCLEECTKQGARSLVLATEMTPRQRLARFIANKTGIAFSNVMLRNLTEEQKGEVLDVLNELPFGYRRIKGWSVDQVCAEIAARRPDVVAIDSIHGMPYSKPAELRMISSQLAAMAAQVNCHMIWVCQLNMARATDKVKPPPVERDIRDTSAIEYDVDNIISVYRNRTSQGSREDTGYLQVLKARDSGLTGTTVNFQLIANGYGFEPRKRPKKTEEEKVKDDPVLEPLAMLDPVDH